MLKLRVNPNFSNALADNRNRFPVVWIKPLLNSPQLKSGKPARIRRKSPEVVEGGSEPEQALFSHKSTYKYLFILSSPVGLRLERGSLACDHGQRNR